MNGAIPDPAGSIPPIPAIEDLYSRNPDPSNPALNLFVGLHSNVHPDDAGGALHFLRYQTNGTSFIQNQSSDPAGGSWWRAVTGTLHRAWSGFANAATSAPGDVLHAGENAVRTFYNQEPVTPTQGAQQDIGLGHSVFNPVAHVGEMTGSAALGGGEGLAKTAFKGGEAYTTAAVTPKPLGLTGGVDQYAGFVRGAETGASGAVQVASDALWRFQHSLQELVTPSMAHYADLGNTLGHLAEAPANLINPFSPENGYQMMAHTAAYYESLANKFGWGYAIGHALPGIAAMMATDGFMGTSEDAMLANAQSEIANTESLIAKGYRITPEQMTNYQRANEYIRVGNEREAAAARATTDAAANTAKRAARIAKKTPLKSAVATGSEFMAAPATALFRIARLAGRPMNDVRLNAAYQVNQAIAQKSDPQLWNDTRGGMVIQRDGKPIDLGRQTALYLGLHPNTAAFDAGSGLFDIYTKYLGADPLGAAGKMVKTLRNTEGFAGGLFKWYRGMGIRSGLDVYNVMDRADVRRAFNFMVDHNGAEIAARFNRGAVTYSPEMLRRLGDATNLSEVAAIHANIADGRAVAFMRAPTVGLYTGIKMGLQSGADYRTAQHILASPDYNLIKQSADRLYEKMGLRIEHQPSAAFVVKADAGFRFRATLREKFAKMFIPRPMWLSQITGKLETSVIHPGDYNSIPAIMNMMRAAGMPRDMIRASGDYLLHSTTPGEFTTAYRNVLGQMVARRAMAGLRAPELDSLSHETEQFIYNEVQRLSGFDGAGTEGTYVAGSNGAAYSRGIDENGIVKSMGGGWNDMGSLRLPEAKVLDNLSRKIEQIAVGNVPELHNLGDYNTLAHEDLVNLAGARNLTEADARVSGAAFHEMRGADSQSAYVMGEHSVPAYRDAAAKLPEELSRIMEGTTGPEAYATAYEYLRTQVQDITDRLNSDLALKKNGYAESSPFAKAETEAQAATQEPASAMSWEDRAKLKGRGYALRDHLTMMNGELVHNEVIDGRALTRVAQYRAAELGLDGADARRFVGEMKAELEQARARNPELRNNFQHVVSGLNKYVSRVFVPMALFSGRWALHVGISETMLNVLRTGPWDFFDAKVAESIARHEIYNPPMQRGELAFIRDVVGGIGLGWDRALLKSMPKAEANRLLDDAVSVVMANDGHLPGGVHQQDTVYQREAWDQAALQHAKYDTGEVDRHGEPKYKTAHYRQGDHFLGTDPVQKPYAKYLAHHLVSISTDRLKRPIILEMNRILTEEPHVLSGKPGSDQWLQSLVDHLMNPAKEAISKLTPSEASRFEASRSVLQDSNLSSTGFRDNSGAVEFTPEQSLTDWARRNVEDVTKSIIGSTDRWVVNKELLALAVSGDQLPEKEMASLVKQMGDRAPRDIQGPAILGVSGRLKGLMSPNLMIDISNVGHDKILGPIVNSIIRDPLYVWEFHQQMEVLRPLIDKGITHEQAMVIAQSNALGNMVKFVHNPKDKTIFEQNVRTAAPFYFAKNQAWRRAFRVLGEDPGAFEKYFKECLGVTNYISTHTQAGQAPSILIPYTQFIGGFAGAMSPISGGFWGLGTPNFNLTGSAGSVTSMVPTGDLGGWRNILGQFASVPFGSLVAVPLKLIRSEFLQPPGQLYSMTHALIGDKGAVELTKLLADFLGPIEANSSIMRDILPSSLFSDATSIIEGLSGSTSSSLATTLNETMGNHIDNLYGALVSRYYGMVTGTPAQRMQQATSAAQQQFASTLTDPTAAAEFIHHARIEAVIMSLVKGVLNFFSPLSLTLNTAFSKSPEFDKLATEKLPNGKLRYPTYQSQFAEFGKRYPNHWADLVAHTESLFGKMPENAASVTVMENNPVAVDKYKYGVAATIPMGGAWSPLSYQLQIELGLRRRETPQEYLNASLITTGNNWYYGTLVPDLMKDPRNVGYEAVPQPDGSSKMTPYLNYNGYLQSEAAAQKYGNTDNPLWHDQFAGKSQRKYVANRTITEVSLLIKDPVVTYLSAADKSKYNELLNGSPGPNGFKGYFATMAQIQEYEKYGLTTVATLLKNQWYTQCQEWAVQPQWAHQSTFILADLVQMPAL